MCEMYDIDHGVRNTCPGQSMQTLLSVVGSTLTAHHQLWPSRAPSDAGRLPQCRPPAWRQLRFRSMHAPSDEARLHCTKPCMYRSEQLYRPLAPVKQHISIHLRRRALCYEGTRQRTFSLSRDQASEDRPYCAAASRLIRS